MKMFRKFACCFVVLTLLLSAGCVRQPREEEDATYHIVASFYPVYIFTLNLIENVQGVSLSNMTDGTGGCLHDYQLTTKDMRLLAGADMLVINGAGMEKFIDKAVGGAKDLTVVDSSAGVTILEEAEDAHEDEEEAQAGEHSHEAAAHIWLSVPNAVRQVDNIYQALREALPAQAETLSANRDAYAARLNALDAELKADAAALTEPIVTFHSAYAYFSQEYGLPVLASIETEEGAEPSAKELAGLKEIMRREQVGSLFVEPEYAGTSAGVLATETGAKIYTLNPITSGENIKTAYEDLMRNNMRTLLDAEGRS
ncbi:MAG: metal ABC transporter substrate-binding protein [Oscillospiraceae bacterium]|jgi:zinc transport system substrate-binding protein|nr:metal ABC transporter substrate-binding protein [Oscillospiraceae bacterium]